MIVFQRETFHFFQIFHSLTIVPSKRLTKNYILTYILYKPNARNLPIFSFTYFTPCSDDWPIYVPPQYWYFISSSNYITHMENLQKRQISKRAFCDERKSSNLFPNKINSPLSYSSVQCACVVILLTMLIQRFLSIWYWLFSCFCFFLLWDNHNDGNDTDDQENRDDDEVNNEYDLVLSIQFSSGEANGQWSDHCRIILGPKECFTLG